MDVVLDSSVILADPWFESQGVRMLLDHVHKVQGNVVLLDVVEAEVAGVMERRITAAVDELEKAHHKARRTRIPSVPTFEPEGLADQCLAEWRKQLERTMKASPLRRVDLSAGAAKKSVFRTVRGNPPCHRKREFRDALIWESVLAFASDRKYEADLVFITANSRDFSASDNSGALHPRLAAEVNEAGLVMQYYTAVDGFVSDHATRFAFLTAEWVLERLPLDFITDIVSEALIRDTYIDYEAAWHEDAEFYEASRVLRVTKLGADVLDVFIWEFDDDHTEIRISGGAEVYAEAECELTKFPGMPGMPRHVEEMLEFEYPYTKELEVRTSIAFEVGAMVEGEDIEDAWVDHVYEV